MQMIGEYKFIQMKNLGMLYYHLKGISIRLFMIIDVENTKILFIPKIFPTAPPPSFHGHYDKDQFLRNKTYLNILMGFSSI